MALTWTLHVGRIKTDKDSVLIHHNTDDFFAAEIDLTSKYPWNIGHMITDSGDLVCGLSYDDDTMFMNEASEDSTEFILSGPNLNRWRFVTETGRYAWYITGYRRNEVTCRSE